MNDIKHQSCAVAAAHTVTVREGATFYGGLSEAAGRFLQKVFRGRRRNAKKSPVAMRQNRYARAYTDIDSDNLRTVVTQEGHDRLPRNVDGRPLAQGEGRLGQREHARFEQLVLPHLDAAFNLARWLTRNDQDAEDVVQEACLRALKYFEGFHGGDSRAWLLTIVRNTCYTWLRQNRAHEITTPFDPELHDVESDTDNPERMLLQSVDLQRLRLALETLPVEYREVIVLRELEDLSYKEIAAIANIPIGTVMSRLARARDRLQQCLKETDQQGVGQ